MIMKKVYIIPQTESLDVVCDDLLRVGPPSAGDSVNPGVKLAIMPGEAPRIPDPAPAGI